MHIMTRKLFLNFIFPGLFCDGTRGYGVPGNANEECIFLCLVLYYHIINHGVPAPFLKKQGKKVKRSWPPSGKCRAGKNLRFITKDLGFLGFNARTVARGTLDTGI